ncbi:ferritin light chain, oocyte isoform-like isoform X1 [Puntigrus tetrazona]|uniref:ferritin light chain, oocyte isoform-like isoform X1 n=1 Tax=Puntigrus tetrazona TaxID=1606681 RepID=UPI001C895C44|nr:ferritin light chain, oocyte isoform-like isoform X1 [Puntigrus tetrazona]
MSEPRVKRIKTCLPLCETHLSSAESPARQNFPTVVEEGLCGVSTLLMEVSYRLEALAETFERSDLALPRVSAYFHQESAKELERAETMLQYLSQRGGKHCSKNIQRPGAEGVRAVLPALELTLDQWKEEMSVMLELNQLACEYGDPHTASVIKSRFIQPLAPKVKLVGDLLTGARRDGTGGFGEYLIDRLQDTLTA